MGQQLNSGTLGIQDFPSRSVRRTDRERPSTVPSKVAKRSILNRESRADWDTPSPLHSPFLVEGQTGLRKAHIHQGIDVLLVVELLRLYGLRVLVSVLQRHARQWIECAGSSGAGIPPHV